MSQLEDAHERMTAAVGLSEVLAAAYTAFDAMLPVIEDQQDQGGPHFAAFVMAGVPAATGRLALVAAPSLPAECLLAGSAGRVSGGRASGGRTAEEVAELLAGLGQVMARRLYDATLTAADADDREACSRASHHARELCAWLGGDAAP
jgi:hypothetical protein